MSGGFTSEPREDEKELLLCPASTGSRPGAAREPQSGERTRSCAYRVEGGGGLEPEDDKSHSFFIKEYVFMQDWSAALPRGSEV